MTLRNGSPPVPDLRQDSAAAVAVDAALYHILANNSVDLIVRGDALGRRTFVSPSCREILGYNPSDLLGGHAYELVHPEDNDGVARIFETLGPEYPNLDLTFRMRRREGAYIWVEARYRYIREDGGRLAIIRDITARKTAEEKLCAALAELEAANRDLERLSHEDGLTGLANRRYFDRIFPDECRRACREHLTLAVIMLDVDYFKTFNDSYGHLEGDDCLIKVCHAVKGVLRRPGDIACRYGGEEVVALLPNTDAPGAMLIANRICGAVVDLSIPHGGSGHGVVTLSAGVSSYRPLGASDRPSELLKAADRALYRAKERGRNRVECGVIREAEMLL